MAIHDETQRKRVERLLGGNFSADDITKLFLFVRDPKRAAGRETVIEIGDFIAHPDERNRGLLTRMAKDTAAMIQFKIERIDGSINLDDVPPSFVFHLKAVSKHLDSTIVKRDTGMSLSTATKMIANVLKKLSLKPSGNYGLSEAITQDEINLVQCYSKYLVSKPAFTGQRLFDEFLGVLRQEHILRKDEVNDFRLKRRILILYAVAAMHGNIIDLGDRKKAGLLVSAGLDGLLNVCAMFETYLPKFDKTHTLAFPLFATDLLAAECCDPEVCRHPNEFGIEVNSSGYLCRIN